MYKKIISHWPYSSYSRESKFRIGLSYYRLGWFASAEQVFKEIRMKKKSKFHEHRAMYWLAKTYRLAEKLPESDRLFIKLGGQVFESYYATKSYLMYRERVDSLYHIDRFLKDAHNPLRHLNSSQSIIMEQFKFVFLIDELLGKEYAFKELERNRYRAESMADWVGLAEIYKRLEAYNKAYRIYDHIDKVYYSNLLSY